MGGPRGQEQEVLYEDRLPYNLLGIQPE